MSHAQSEGVFQSLLDRFGLIARKAKFDNKRWSTISAFAVSCGYNVENVPDSALLTKVVGHVLDWDGNGDEPLQTNNIGQLFVHCAQAHLADLRSEFDPRGTEAPAKMHKFDRNERRVALKNAMRAHVPEIEDDDMDPAWEPENELYNMFKEDELGDYMGPECFPTRRQEKLWKQNNRKGKCSAAGTALWKMLTGEEVEEDEQFLDNDVRNELHLLEGAFKRRGILFHAVGFMSYKTHEVWRRTLWKAMRQTPTFASESAPGVPDILKADEKIWCLLAEATTNGIQIRGGRKPLEDALDRILKEPEVTNILMVRPRGDRVLATDKTSAAKTKPPKREPTAQASSADEKAARRIENQDRHIANLKKKLQTAQDGKSQGCGGNSKGQGRGGGRGGGKGNKGKGKGNKGGDKGSKGGGKGDKSKKRKFVALPPQLIGLDPTYDGEPICFACNLPGGCDKAKWGEKCPKGWHMCMQKGCKKHRGYVGNHRNLTRAEEVSARFWHVRSPVPTAHAVCSGPLSFAHE